MNKHRIDILLRGLTILRPHYTEDADPRMTAPDDEFNLPPTDTPVGEPEFAELKALRWYQPEAAWDQAGEPVYDGSLGWAYNL